MAKNLYEILCPDGYVKNGFDKKKLKEIFSNTMVVNYNESSHTLEHIDIDSESSKISMADDISNISKLTFKVSIDSDCRLSNLANSTINFVKFGIINGNIEFILENPQNLPLNSEEYEILKEFQYEI